MDNEIKLAIGCIALLCVLITSATLFGISFDIIEPNRVGLTFDDATQHVLINRGLEVNGRHFVGLGKRFVIFPTDLQQLEFYNVPVRSHDGLVIYMDYSVQYHLDASLESIYRLYLDWGEDEKHIEFYKTLSLKVVRDVASRYLAFDYFDSREVINEEMFEEMDTALARVYARTDAFQLINMEFNYRFADVIEETEVTKQGIQQADFEKEKVTVQAQGLREVAEKLARIAVVDANATAFSYLEEILADSQALEYRVEAQKGALLGLIEDWELQDTEDILAYMNVVALEESQADTISLGMQLPAPIV